MLTNTSQEQEKLLTNSRWEQGTCAIMDKDTTGKKY